LMRSESWAFIWQPKVVTWYRRKAQTLYRRLRAALWISPRPALG
jgi:hypothetical protein